MPLRTKVLQTKTRGKVETVPGLRGMDLSLLPSSWFFFPLCGRTPFCLTITFENLAIFTGSMSWWLKKCFMSMKRIWSYLRSVFIGFEPPRTTLPSRGLPALGWRGNSSMDVLDENEALQQFFEGKSSVAAMLSTSEQCRLTFTLWLAAFT